jgi:hypothetical protein
MANEKKRGGKRTRNTHAVEAEKQPAEQPMDSPYASLTPEEFKTTASQLLPNIFSAAALCQWHLFHSKENEGPISIKRAIPLDWDKDFQKLLFFSKHQNSRI